MLGERIRETRKRNQMNQTEFSQLIGVSQGTLSELEQNKYNPSLETILAIIKVFNVNATWLLFGDVANKDGILELAEELNKVELLLVNGFRMLSIRDQREIMNIIKLKNS
ncbi:XRE family transcriptional regulator [Brevibacillus invocatus]|uniref:XRE family transcriptional regulator n=1 Tax=Brevibacillus invocatus TaxID=173959 RepID=A0A3M8BWK2_9BACL|nr:helix-turn-helix transcriptional regulator [Brevibacillus invocatus]RNB67713.1 XRE family transcriptional regulator [Brevibacillus invocatus]